MNTISKNYFKSLNGKNFHNIGLIWSLLVGSVNYCDLGSSFNHIHVFGFADNELDDIIGSLEGWNFESNNTSHAVHLSDGMGIDRAGQNIDLWSIFGDHSCELARLSKHDDETNVLLVEN